MGSPKSWKKTWSWLIFPAACIRARRRSGAEFDASIFAGLGLTSIDAMDARLIDADNAVDEVNVGEHEGNLFRGP